MKAIRVYEFGSPDVLVYEDVPDLQAGPGQILVKVESAAVNYADVMRRSNAHYPFPTRLPFTPGSEVAGTVAALGPGVDGPPVGTPVLALVGSDGSSGYAEYALAAAPQVIPMPPTLSADEACGLVVAGGAALLALREVGRLQKGERVLVQGAAGGVGSYAIQIARLLGAGSIIGAASSPAKRQRALVLGADEVVDYTHPDWPNHVREITAGQGVDLVLEIAGGESLAQSLRCLAPFGRVVVLGAASRLPTRLDDETILRFFYDPALNQSIHVFNLGLWFGLKPQPATAALGDLLGLAASGQITAHVDHVLPLSQAAEAHRLLEQRQTTGKIVLKP
jgi:NADPH:quinone reductase